MDAPAVLILREARLEDARLLWEWSRDPLVLAMAFDPAPVSWEDHRHWMAERLADGRSVMLIAELADHAPIGQLRFDRMADGWEVDFSIAAAHRGKGYGRRLLQQAVARVQHHWDVQTLVIARVLAVNAASRAVCEAAGFVPMEYGTDDGRAYVRLERQVRIC